ncbi:hypothetical protein CAEBREN_05769 [Caenorhabditis brenneri]|uniref:SPK domain-containing protein n=1 Tax=Caenorhabditis brenneri TaxID=135651 RepID=G0NSX9_CAEBE|nr:hypothetical protein CAEBREN_05769 [Caenorhabditis brenneri]
MGQKRGLRKRQRGTKLLKFMSWIVNRIGDTDIPIPLAILQKCWAASKKNFTRLQKRSMKVRKVALHRDLKNIDSLEGFTNLQKVQMLFILSFPVNEAFENILKAEGHHIELIDSVRRISFFRSQDGTFERREPDHDVKPLDLNLLAGQIKYEDKEESDDDELMDEEEPLDWDEQEALDIKQELSFADNEQGAATGIKEEAKADFVEEFIPPDTMDCKPSSSDPVIPVYPSASTVSESLEVLRSSVMALRYPSMTKTLNLIEEALVTYGSNMNLVPMADITLNLPSIIYLAMKGDPTNKNEEQVNRKAYLQFLLQFVILLDSRALDEQQVALEWKIDETDDQARIRLEKVKNGLSILLIAITA